MKVSPDAQIPRRKKTRPARVKHVPIRTCVVCRESGSKSGLTRIVRTPEGEVRIDLNGRQNGRGAYLCDKQGCWQRATSSNVLSRSLNIPLSDEAVASLTEFAAGLASSDVPAVDTKDSNA